MTWGGVVTEAQVCWAPKPACSFTLSTMFVHIIVRDATKVGKWATEIGARAEVRVRNA